MKIRYVAAFAVAAFVAAPAAAQGATKDVIMGPTPKVSKSLEKVFGDLNNFYPANISVRQGDKVRFSPFGFHNASFPKKGGKPVDLLVPSGTVTGAVDAANAPFWFNNLPSLGFNPAVMKSNFGKTVTVTGAKAVNSGLPLEDKPKPFTVKFTKRGSFTYFCEVHPGMKGKVTVKAKSARVPSAKADTARGAKQMAKDAKATLALSKTNAPANTVLMGAAGSGGSAESFGVFPGLFPGKISVPAGTTLEFKMHPQSREVHTATFGPGNPEKEPNSYLGALAKTFEGPGPFNGQATYSSEPPTAPPAVLTPALHGNGFWSSGLMVAFKGTPFGSSSKVTFGAPGAYTFYCLIHPFMTGTVTVT